jgi:hypothetical protein
VDFATPEDFLKHVNAERLAKVGKWVFLTCTVNKVPVQYKAYNCWVQILRTGTAGEPGYINDSSVMGLTPTKFKAYLLEALQARTS